MLPRFYTQLLSFILGKWLTAYDIVQLDGAACGANRAALKDCYRCFPHYFDDAFGSICDASIPLSGLTWMHKRSLSVAIRCLGLYISDFRVFKSYSVELQQQTMEDLHVVTLLCLDLLDIDLSSAMPVFKALSELAAFVCIHGNDMLPLLMNASPKVVLCEIVNSPQMTDEGLIRLYDQLRDLHSLVIKNCLSLTARSIDHIFQHPRNLSELCIIRCPISVADVAQLEFPVTGIVVAITAGTQSITL